MRTVLALMSGVTLLVACGGTSDSGPEDDHRGGAGHSASSGSGGTSSAGQGSSGGGSASQAGSSAGRSGSGSGGTDVAGTAGAPPDVGSGNCQDFTPCGGDLVGTWLVDVCTDPELEVSETVCPEAQTETKLNGTVTWRADGTMTTQLRATVTSTLPSSCVAMLGECGEPGGSLADCAPAAAGACVCTFVSEDEGDSNYTASPDGLLAVSSGGAPDYSYFCRQGEQAWARSVDSDGGITVLHLTKQ